MKVQVLILTVFGLVYAIPTEDKKERVLNHDLSSQEHYQQQQHNLDYDHEAFLGDEAKTFDHLSPEESRKRLGIIVDKIDKDGDQKVTHEELKDWIKYTQKRYIREDVVRQWTQHNPDNKETIDWEDYRKDIYGFMDDMDEKQLDNDDQGVSYKSLLRRDRRRWTIADTNGDDKLNKEEFTGFLHPEETEHMKEIVVIETMEDIDKDNDGKISLEEYVGDMHQPSSEDEPEPEWVKSEREHFAAYRDKDHDNVLNLEEVKQWIMPDNFDHAEAEARHLIFEADADHDETLTKEEILAKYDLFVGSQATDFGEALARHDEF